MTPDTLAALLDLDGITAEPSGTDHVRVEVGGGVPTLTLRPSGLLQSQRTSSPTGDPAIAFFTNGVDGRPPAVTVVVLAGDIVFTTAPEAGAEVVTGGGTPMLVQGMPAMVSFQEMRRDLDLTAAELGRIGEDDDLNYDALLGRTIMSAAFVLGAEHAGLDVTNERATLDALIAQLRTY